MAEGGQRFDIIRKRLRQQAKAGGQGEQERLSREFTRRGLGGSGAAIKAGQQSEQAQAQRLQGAEETVALAELQEKQRLGEIQQAREFQTTERLGAQEFGAAQAGLAREFQTGERLAGQEFGAEQAGIQRQFASGEAAKQRGFSKGLFDLEQAFKEKSLKLQNTQFKKQMKFAAKQFDLDKDIAEFNKRMAEKNFNKKGLLGGLFGGLPVIGGLFGGGGGPGGATFGTPGSSGNILGGGALGGISSTVPGSGGGGFSF